MTPPRIYLYRVNSARTGIKYFVFARTAWGAHCAARRLGCRGSVGVRLAHPRPF